MPVVVPCRREYSRAAVRVKLSLRVCVALAQLPRRTYSAVAVSDKASPTYSRTSASQWTPAIAKNGAPIVGATPSRPAQLIFRSIPRDKPVAAEREHQQLARDRDRDRPPRQQREIPRDDHPRNDEQPVDHRVQQRPEPAELAGQPRREAVEVVGPADHPEQHHGERALAVHARERDHQEDGDQREPDVADRVRDRPRVQRLARPRLRRRSGPERSIPNRRRLVGSWALAGSTGGCATARRPPPPRPRAPLTRASCPRRT